MRIKPTLIFLLCCLVIQTAGQNKIIMPEKGLCAHRGAMEMTLFIPSMYYGN